MKIIGLMSGTSLDGIDAALCEIDGSGENLRAELLHSCTSSFEPFLRARILNLCSSQTANIETIARLDVELGEVFGDAACRLLKQSGARADEISCIASHGQTIGHWPPQNGAPGATWQLGDAATIAARTGIAVVANFRAADMAAGGQGAPLVPYVDWCLLRSETTHRIAQNIGGIANATWLRANATLNDVRAWDSGPGVMLIDALAQNLKGQSCDFDGACAARGTVSNALLERALAHPFFAIAPPKSCGRAEFGEAFAHKFLADARALSLNVEDILATATRLTARTVTDSCKRFAPEIMDSKMPTEIILSGGGARNAALVQMLREEVGNSSTIKLIDEFGIDGDAKEALAFAVLASETLCGAMNTVPAATGARHAVCAGSVTR